MYGVRRRWLITVITASVVTVLATALSGLAVNVATNSPAEWFPSLNAHPLLWLAGSLPAILIAGLVTWWAQREYESSLLTTVPVTQRPESWVIDRPEEMRAVVRALTHHRKAATVGITTAVHGAGGFGKTTMARLVRAHPRVLKRFGGRVHWVTLGRDARRGALVEKINDLVKQIDPVRAQPFTDVRLAAEHLAAVLADGPRRLVIVDDVWFEDQLAAFPVAGRCARLVTTRLPSLVSGAVPVKVDQMSDDQARRVLTANIRHPLPTAVLDGLLEETGRWPLLLRIVNRIVLDQARSRTDVAEIARELLDQLRIAGPLQVDILTGASVLQLDVNDPDQRDEAVRATIEAGTGLLSDGEYTRFAELSIFAEDETVPVPLIATLWQATGGLEPAGSRALCARLDDLALLNLTPTDTGGTITLHDVVRDFLAEGLGDQALIGLHRTLIESVVESLPRVAGPAGTDTPAVPAWWDLPENSRYLRDHLVEHLLGAGLEDEAETLATDLRWVISRLEETGPAGPAADLARLSTAKATHLAGLFSSNAHLLSPTETAHSCADILLDRVVRDPVWQEQAQRLSTDRTMPRLVSVAAPPDLPDPALRQTFASKTLFTQGIAMDLADMRVITVDIGGTVQHLDLRSGRSTIGYEGSPKSSVFGLALSADGNAMVTSDQADGSLTVYDIRTGKSSERITENSFLVAISESGGTMVSRSQVDGRIRIWNVATRRETMTLDVDRAWTAALAITRDGTTVALAGDDHIVRMIDVRVGRETTRFTAKSRIDTIAFAASGAWLAISHGTETMGLWDCRTGTQIGSLTDRTSTVHAVGVAEDDSQLVTISPNGIIRIWDVATALASNTSLPPSRKAPELIQSGETFAVFNSANPVTVNCPDGQQHTIDLNSLARHLTKLTPDGSRLATEQVESENSVEVWDVKESKRIAICKFGKKPIYAIAISADGRWVAATGYRRIPVHDLNTGRIRRLGSRWSVGYWWNTVTWFRRVMGPITFSPDGAWLADPGGPETRLWDVGTGRLLTSLKAPDTWVHLAVAAPDGEHVIVAGDEAAIVWHVDGRRIATLPAPQHSTHIAITSDNRLVAAVNGSGELWVIDVASGRVLAVTRVDSPLRTCAWSENDRHVITSGDTTRYRFEFRVGGSGDEDAEGVAFGVGVDA